MRSDSTERERLEMTSDRFGPLNGLTAIPYIAAYLALVLTLTGSLNASNGVFIVILAALLIGSSVGPGRRWRPSITERWAVAGAAAALGLSIAILVGNTGLG